MRPTPEDLDALSRDVRAGMVSARLDPLVTHLARLVLQREAAADAPEGLTGLAYSPNSTYDVGQTVAYQGQDFAVTAVRRRRNPRQGEFAVVDLRAEDGDVVRVVAGVSSEGLTPTRQAVRSQGYASPTVQFPPPSSEPTPRDGAENVGDAGGTGQAQIAAFVKAHREALQAALLADPRFSDVMRSAVTLPFSTQRQVRALGASRPRGLFAEHVLSHHIHTRMETWEDGAPRALRQIVAALHPLTALAMQEGRDWTARETWQRFVLPTLHLLGWSEVGPPKGGCYDLVVQTRRDGLAPEVDHGDVTIAVRPVRWGADLGAPTAMEAGRPTIDLIGYLISRDAKWGILTNGCQWRLYCSSQGDSDIGSTAVETYEFDLSDIIASLNVDGGLRPVQWQDLMLWADLTRANSYVSTDLVPSLVERLKRDTTDYAWQATRRLRTQLLDSALPEIAGDFYAFELQQRSSIDAVSAADEATLARIMQGTLSFVARLLGVLFAETRSALPMHNPSYRGQSLTTVQRWAITQVRDGHPLSDSVQQTPRYDALMALFRQLEHGSAALGLPSYSGGLFSPVDAAHGFLEHHRLSDRVVAHTLAALGGVSTDDGLSEGEIDYTALSVRHLSAVWGGVMQHMLSVVEGTPDRLVFTGPATQSSAGRRELVPDYIGYAAIERMLLQVLSERAVDFSRAMDDLVSLRGREAQADVTAPEVGTSAAVRAAERTALTALLGLKVLDPAARAGGLLVATLDTLIDGVIGILADYHATHPNVPWAWDPVYREIQDARTALETEIAAQGIAPTSVAIEDASVLARLIAERSLYGVDRRSLAVMMARTSLQMRAFAAGVPFPRLHHHLRCGDSLHGMYLSEICEHVPALANLRSDLRVSLAASLSRGTMERPVEQLLHPYAMLLSVWLSEDYGNRGAQELVRRRGHDLLSALRGETALGSDDRKIVARARRLADAHGFLHWEIAFPEVFLIPDDALTEQSWGTGGGGTPDSSPAPQAGFDVVLGRPPSSSELGPAVVPSPDVGYAALFSSERRGPFTELANRLVRQPGGRIAFLITSSEVVT